MEYQELFHSNGLIRLLDSVIKLMHFYMKNKAAAMSLSIADLWVLLPRARMREQGVM